MRSCRLTLRTEPPRHDEGSGSHDRDKPANACRRSAFPESVGDRRENHADPSQDHSNQEGNRCDLSGHLEYLSERCQGNNRHLRDQRSKGAKQPKDRHRHRDVIFVFCPPRLWWATLCLAIHVEKRQRRQRLCCQTPSDPPNLSVMTAAGSGLSRHLRRPFRRF